MIKKVEMTKNVSEDLTATQNVYSTHGSSIEGIMSKMNLGAELELARKESIE